MTSRAPRCSHPGADRLAVRSRCRQRTAGRLHRGSRGERGLRPARPSDGGRALPGRATPSIAAACQTATDDCRRHALAVRWQIAHPFSRHGQTRTSVRSMRWMVIVATLAAGAALTFGALAIRTSPGDASFAARRRPQRRERSALLPRTRRDPAARGARRHPRRVRPHAPRRGGSCR